MNTIGSCISSSSSTNSTATSSALPSPLVTPNPIGMSRMISPSTLDILSSEDISFRWADRQIPPAIERLFTDIKRYSQFSAALLDLFPQPATTRQERQHRRTTTHTRHGKSRCSRDDPVLKEMDSVVMSMLGYSNSSTPVVVTPKKSIRSTAKGISSISASRSNVCEECGAVPKQEIGVATMDKSNKAIDRLTLNNKPNYETGDRCIKKVVNPLRTCTMANELLPPPPIRPPRPVSLDLDLLKQEVPSVVVLQRKVTRQHSPGSPGIKLQSGSKLSTRRSTNLRDSNRGEGSIEQKHVQKVSIFKAMSQSVIQMGSQAKRIFMGNSRLSALQIGTLPPLPVTSSLNPDTDIPKSHRSNSEFWSPSIIPIVSLRESAAAAAAAVEATENHTFDSRIGTRDIGLPTFVPIHVPVRSESRLKRSRQFSTANAPINK